VYKTQQQCQHSVCGNFQLKNQAETHSDQKLTSSASSSLLFRVEDVITNGLGAAAAATAFTRLAKSASMLFSSATFTATAQITPI